MTHLLSSWHSGIVKHWLVLNDWGHAVLGKHDHFVHQRQVVERTTVFGLSNEILKKHSFFPIPSPKSGTVLVCCESNTKALDQRLLFASAIYKVMNRLIGLYLHLSP